MQPGYNDFHLVITENGQARAKTMCSLIIQSPEYEAIILTVYCNVQFLECKLRLPRKRKKQKKTCSVNVVLIPDVQRDPVLRCKQQRLLRNLQHVSTHRFRPTATVQLSTRAKMWQASHLSLLFLLKIKFQLTEPCTWTPVRECVRVGVMVVVWNDRRS